MSESTTNKVQFDPNAFNTDNQQLNSDLQELAAVQKSYSSSIDSYNSAMEALANTKDASRAMVLLALILANSGCSEESNNLGMNGAALQVQGDVTKLGNDIEDITNQDSSDPSYVTDVATYSETMYKALSDPTNPLYQALGKQASDTLAAQFLVIRQQVYDPNLDDNATQGWYFIAQGVTPPSGQDPKNPLITDYATFQADLAARGDPSYANEAAKQKTDAFNQNTSTTQSTNAATQELITNSSNMLKAIQAFVTDLFHSIMDAASTANKAMSRS